MAKQKVEQKQNDMTEKKPQKTVQAKGPKKKPGWILFMEDVQVEMRKVTWPSRKEIIGSTTALIVATLLISLFLGVVDFALAKGVQPALAGTPDIWSYVTLVIFASILVWVYRSN